MDVSQISTGFIEIPGQISLNIFAQGCKIKCPGCHNSHLWEFGKGNNIHFEQLSSILEEYALCQWVCFLGGEPTDQPEEFVAMSKEIKRLGKNICLYTGRYFEEIEKLLICVDLVVDSPFRQEDGPVTKVGTNQRIWLKKNNEWCRVENWDELSELFLNNLNKK
jgi:anaerobic ribonucleoside-triphosphate reductase activating protein